MEAESGADRHHFLLQAFTSNGKNRQREKLHGGGVTAKSAAEAQLGEAAAGEAGGQSSPPASTVSVSLSSMVPFVMSHRASGSKLHCQNVWLGLVQDLLSSTGATFHDGEWIK